ncbi:MAG: hypothetical protein LBK56_07235 [Gracilibacteraceae bacterium]|jgi:hypothetical protein|nr:hypothetical protein [Gracilibacteraceae bacterium]
MKMYNKEHQVMVDVNKVVREEDDLVMTAKLMGAYSMPLILPPEEMPEAFKLMTREIVFYLPAMITKGYQKALDQEGATFLSFAAGKLKAGARKAPQSVWFGLAAGIGLAFLFKGRGR